MDDPAVAFTSIQNELESTRRILNYERFIILLVIVIAVDMWAFPGMSNWTAPLVIGILELIGLMVAAGRLGITEAQELLDKCLAPFHKG